MTATKQIQPPTLSDVLAGSKRDTFLDLNCINIGIIQSFDTAKQTASVQIALKTVTEIKPDGTKILKERPVLLECPVMVLFGGTAFISLPIQVGDECIVLFNDREIDNWFVNGGIQTPTTGRAHDVSDGLCIVGVRSLQNSIASYLANGIRLSYGGGSARVDLQEAAINSLAALFTHTGDMLVHGDVEVDGNVLVDGNFTILGVAKGNGGTISIDDDVVQTPGKTLSAGNGATGTFNIVTVVDGIVTGGS